MRRPTVIGSLVLALGALAIVGLCWRGQAQGTGTAESAPGDMKTNDFTRAASSPLAHAESGAASREAAALPANPNIRTLRLVREDGSGVAGAEVIPFLAYKRLAAGLTNETGEVALPDLPGGSQLFISAPGRAPTIATPPPPPERNVVLPSGAEVSGVVLVDEQPPKDPIALRLAFDRSPAAPRDAGTIPNDLLLSLGATTDLFLETGAAGSFRFEGLANEFAGALRAPYEYQRITNGATTGTLRLERPETGLVLRLHRRPRIIGRLIDAKTNDPIPLKGMTLSLVGPDGSSITTTTKDDGRFAIAVSSEHSTRMKLWVDLQSGAQSALVDREVDLSRDLDLGDIRYVAKRKVGLTVVDASGAPIAGAIAVAGDNESPPTDAAGHTSLQCSGLTLEANVGVLGYLPARVALPPDQDCDRRVALQASTLVEVRWFVEDPAAFKHGHIRASSKSLLFEGDGFHEDSEIKAGAASFANGRRSAAGSEAFGELSRLEAIRWNHLLPGVEITFELLAPLGESLAKETITLKRGEHRVVELRANAQMHRLRGIVVDREGNPLAGAVSWVRGESNEQQGFTQSDAGGLLLFSALFSDEVTIRVAKSGFTPIERRVKTQLSDSEDPVRFVLEAGRTVSVTAEDTNGLAVPIVGLRVEAAGVPEIPVAVEGNVWVVRDVPAGEVTLVLTAAGRAWRRKNDASEPRVKFTLPVAGSVVIRLAKTVGPGVYVGVALDANEGATLSTGASGEQLAAGRPELRFATVAPGRYTLIVRTTPVSGSELDPADAFNTNKTIEVRSGETTTVTWDGALK